MPAAGWRERRLFLVGALLVALNLGLVAAIVVVTREDRAGVAESQTAAAPAPAAARLENAFQDAIAETSAMRTPDRGAVGPCGYCADLEDIAGRFRERARSSLDRVRTLQTRIGESGASSRDTGPNSPGARNARSPQSPQSPMIVRLRNAERDAARAIAGWRAIAANAAQCGRENFCRQDGAAIPEAAADVDCRADAAELRAARDRLEALAAAVTSAAKSCRSVACPAADCAAGSVLGADLSAAADAGRILHTRLEGGVSRSGVRAAGGAVLDAVRPDFAGVKTDMERLQQQLADGLADPRDIAAAREVLARLDRETTRLAGHLDRPWGVGGSSPADIGEGLWRLRLLALKVATMRDRTDGGEGLNTTAGGTEDLALALLPHYADAMLDVARLDAVLDLPERLDARPPDSDGREACQVRGWRRVAGRLSEARAALSLCLARSACQPAAGGEYPAEAKPPDGALAAFELLADASRFDPARARAAEVGDAGGVSLAVSRNDYRAGEVVSVTARMTDAACMANGGTVAMVRASDGHTLRRYRLDGPPSAEILFEAPSPAGAYRIEARAPAARGGAAIATADIATEELGATCDGYTGVWETDFGKLRMVDRAGAVTGTYRRTPDTRPGFLIGTRTERRLDGVWLSEIGGGGTRLVLAKDGRRFSGTWSHRLDKMAGTGRWTGTCAAP